MIIRVCVNPNHESKARSSASENVTPSPRYRRRYTDTEASSRTIRHLSSRYVTSCVFAGCNSTPGCRNDPSDRPRFSPTRPTLTSTSLTSNLVDILPPPSVLHSNLCAILSVSASSSETPRSVSGGSGSVFKKKTSKTKEGSTSRAAAAAEHTTLIIIYIRLITHEEESR